MTQEQEKACLAHYEIRGKFISTKYFLKLSPEGKGGIVFNISQMQMFTIIVQNNTDAKLIGYLTVSPDKKNYKIDPASKETIEPNTLYPFVSRVFLKYTAIEIEGPAEGELYIYFQGQY